MFTRIVAAHIRAASGCFHVSLFLITVLRIHVKALWSMCSFCCCLVQPRGGCVFECPALLVGLLYDPLIFFR